MLIKIIGSPGCGKTTKLLTIMESLIAEGIPAHKIGFVTFTTAGVNEAKERACKRFKLSPDDLPFFRTLHSFAYMLLSLTREQVFAGKNLYEFAMQFNLKLSWGNESFNTNDDKAMNLIKLSAVREEELHTTYKKYPINVPYERVLYLKQKYLEYKELKSVLDFNDMLKLAKDCEPPPIKYLIVDEAQDLSKLQWEVVNMLTKNAEKVYMAGDDKQCIYVHGGAEPELFVEKQGKLINLDQSYRIPSTVHQLADKIINQVKVKHDISWKPREEEGFVKRMNAPVNLCRLLNEKKSWAILGRNHSILEKYIQQLMQTDYLFTINGEPPVKMEALHVVSQVINDFPRKNKTTIRKYFPEWDSSTTNLSSQTTTLSSFERKYISLLLNRFKYSENIDFSQANIKLQTIHASKGTEADNVILINGMTKTVYNEYKKNRDNELRVLFVGVTRARQGLYIIKDNNYCTYEEL